MHHRDTNPLFAAQFHSAALAVVHYFDKQPVEQTTLVRVLAAVVVVVVAVAVAVVAVVAVVVAG
jgi:hypothetical protein